MNDTKTATPLVTRGLKKPLLGGVVVMLLSGLLALYCQACQTFIWHFILSKLQQPSADGTAFLLPLSPFAAITVPLRMAFAGGLIFGVMFVVASYVRSTFRSKALILVGLLLGLSALLGLFLIGYRLYMEQIITVVISNREVTRPRGTLSTPEDFPFVTLGIAGALLSVAVGIALLRSRAKSDSS